jgi:hypothetical protein
MDEKAKEMGLGDINELVWLQSVIAQPAVGLNLLPGSNQAAP